ncbi:prolyl oligopeptidase family serine peptidase [Pleionea sp. CnH1-48]|uniref:S9 family peptidase n=1 Tax=Pleionea sp. CnH1-48 TaxID=2954494 RepID=UPI0020975755|nr:prolyl oligopeptidase family serine peptidase [Pleionea sp. CnH1-48]MCO7225412.1 prolyl oligopeptidase family serine peptidase [Pleionea sp. CnH1-48]
MSKVQKAYGSWPSPIDAQMVSSKGTRLGHMQYFNRSVYWLESRPELKGKGVIVCWDDENKKRDLDLGEHSVRSRAHEYGGGDFLVTRMGVFYCNDEDQAVYLLTHDGEQKGLTTPSEKLRAWRYTDFSMCVDNDWLFCVRERHDLEPVKNELVCIDLSSENWGEVKVVAEGYDFYSFPRVSPGGRRICWTCWNQPNMPWDTTELWVADIDRQGQLSAQHCVAGCEDESIYQPSWSPDGVLHFISDRSGWANLYSFRDGVINALTPVDREFSIPQWIFATSTYCFGEGDNIYAAYFEDGQQQLCHINTDTGHIEPLALPFKDYPGQVHFGDDALYVVAGAPMIPQGIYKLDINDELAFHQLDSESSLPVTQDMISVAQPISFQSSSNYASHAFYYAPCHSEYDGQEGEQPPLIVMSHGGPTAATSSTLSWAIQFWTSRGFAVVDVNYGGSTGYGRDYRELLNEQWGIVDVNDCVYAARYLVEQGKADAKRLLIRGGSAGGFTTLCALTFFDDFAAGMTRYGVTELESLVTDSHKFEARYLDSIVGAYPDELAQYKERSPIYHTDQLSCPILILQGSEDKVVPPSQSHKLVAALSEKEIPHAYIEFEGEGHGFRMQQNIERALEAELYFYCKILAIPLEESITPVDIV